MMAFMATILANGVAASFMSGYSARPDTPGHEAYGIGHILYSRPPPVGHRAATDAGPRDGHCPVTDRRTAARPERMAPRRVRASARGSVSAEATRHREGPRRE
ncbi:hypothetical protein GCM10022232_71040 [Streptomyces plumbiresistens]|uniref:Uncharacterized protein n=1 Tax=Streptomyces plumbiresistens TaxID=511811 RepID=A0ABP7SW07_9ACTN